MKSFIDAVEQKIEENKVNKEKRAQKLRQRQLARVDTDQKFSFSFGSSRPLLSSFAPVPHQDKKKEMFVKSRILKKEKASKNLFSLMKRPE